MGFHGLLYGDLYLLTIMHYYGRFSLRRNSDGDDKNKKGKAFPGKTHRGPGGWGSQNF